MENHERDQEQGPDADRPRREAPGQEPADAAPATQPLTDGDPATPPPTAASDLGELVSQLRSERDEYLELAQRARAEFDNYRKRAARESDEALHRGRSEVGRAVVPAIDSLDRALETASGELAEGLALVHRELISALAGAGIERIDPTGEKFDPNVHEALSSRPVADGEEGGTVVETVRRGYRAGDGLIRPAQVVVSA